MKSLTSFKTYLTYIEVQLLSFLILSNAAIVVVADGFQNVHQLQNINQRTCPKDLASHSITTFAVRKNRPCMDGTFPFRALPSVGISNVILSSKSSLTKSTLTTSVHSIVCRSGAGFR
jgi:hypothetical protein